MSENDDPFLTLILESLNLMHPRFAAANGREYSPAEAGEPPAARKVRERSFLMEFYHEFRRLWDQAFPVQLGLGHIIVQGEPEIGSRSPDLLFWQLGEHGQPERRLGALSLALLSNPEAVTTDQTLLSRFHKTAGYQYAVSVIVGRLAAAPANGLPSADGVTVILFDVDRWSARLVDNSI
jgi:hypothetical protein